MTLDSVAPSPVTRRAFVGVMGSIAAGVVAWDAAQIVETVSSRTTPIGSTSSAGAGAGSTGSDTVAAATAADDVAVSVTRGETSLDLRSDDLGLFPSISIVASAHRWTGIALSDLFDAVGAQPDDVVRVVTTAASSASTATTDLGRVGGVRGDTVLALSRDGHHLDTAPGRLLLVSTSPTVPTGALISIEVGE